jgi:HEAT repeat protein
LQGILDPGRPIHSIELDTLSDLDAASLARFQAAWAEIPASRRRSLVLELLEVAEERVDVSFRWILQWLLDDEDPWVRAHAIDGLWEEEDVRLIGPLTRLLSHDPAPEVRAAAAQSLGRYLLLGELERIDAGLAARVEHALHTAYIEEEQEPFVRRRVVEALAYTTAANIPAIIRNAYEDEDDGMRLSAVFAMGRSADLRWSDIVLAELASVDAAMRFEAARASGELELAEAVPDLIALLDEDDVELRDTVVWALGRIGGPEAQRALRACCESDDDELVEAAEEALAEMSFLSGDDDLPAFMVEY